MVDDGHAPNVALTLPFLTVTFPSFPLRWCVFFHSHSIPQKAVDSGNCMVRINLERAKSFVSLISTSYGLVTSES